VIELRIHGEPRFDVYELIDVYEAHRLRFIDQLTELSADEWATPSRCSEWTVHQVVRHLADINELGVHDDGSSPFDGFDPRTTPRRWLAPSDDETPADTLERIRAGSTVYFAATRASEKCGVERFVEFPFGKEPSTMLIAHAFWDSWVHERDVLVPLGREHRTDDAGTQFATTYALFISSAVAALFGTPVNATFELSGLGGGIYEVTHDGDGAIVRSSRDDMTSGADAGALSDALSGRGSVDNLLEPSPPGLSSLANFFNAPV
jgi:uncharacterized protein (TIGR03083 family)